MIRGWDDPMKQICTIEHTSFWKNKDLRRSLRCGYSITTPGLPVLDAGSQSGHWRALLNAHPPFLCALVHAFAFGPDFCSRLPAVTLRQVQPLIVSKRVDDAVSASKTSWMARGGEFIMLNFRGCVLRAIHQSGRTGRCRQQWWM
jgi:hypothetical protein